MPKLRLIGLLNNVKIFESLDLILQLYNESDLCWDTKIAHNQKADCFKKREPLQLLLIPP
jgi:hypothetical protein